MRTFILYIFLLCSFVIQAKEKKPGEYFSIHFDNDLFLDILGEGHGEDRNYTMGLGFVWTQENPSANWIYAPHDAIAKSLSIGHHSKRNGVKQELGFIRYKISGTAFTPEEISRYDVIQGDRPYSFLLNYGIEQMTVWQSSNSHKPDYAEKTEFSIGIYGLAIGEAVQSFIHKHISNSSQPNGWANQISDGGEPSLLVKRSQKYMTHDGIIKNISYDIATVLDVAIGYQTYVQAGFDIRLGHTYITPFYEHDFAPLGAQTKMIKEEPKDLTGAYVYLGYRLTGTIYNVGLQGQFKKNPYEISAGDIKRLTHTYGFGVVVKPYHNFGISFSLIWRSPEFHSELYERTHGYGSLNAFWQF